jgi:ribosomal protein L19
MNIIQTIEREELARVTEGKQMPDFEPGDTLKVNVKVVEGERTRVQAYEGVCIARSGAGLNESFTVRKISYGEGVERVFPLFTRQRWTRSKSCAAARCVARSSITCAACAGRRRASPSVRTLRAARARQRKPRTDRFAQRRCKGRREPAFFLLRRKMPVHCGFGRAALYTLHGFTSAAG